MDAKLVVIGGNATKSEVKLRLPMTIGRTKDAGLSIAHPMVSRKHCTLYEREGALYIRDNQSANGTFVNDNRILGDLLIKPGDRLTVGPLTFVAIYRLPKSASSFEAKGPLTGSRDPIRDSDADLAALIKAAQDSAGESAKTGSAFDQFFADFSADDAGPADSESIFGDDKLSENDRTYLATDKDWKRVEQEESLAGTSEEDQHVNVNDFFKSLADDDSVSLDKNKESESNS